MTERRYPNSGAMFAREKRSEKAADFGGQFTLDDDILDYIVRKAERGEPVELEISGWKRRSTNGGTLLGLKIELPWKERGGDRGGRSTGGNNFRSGSGGDRPRENVQARGSYRSGGGQPRYPSRNEEPGRYQRQGEFPEEFHDGNKEPWD